MLRCVVDDINIWRLKLYGIVWNYIWCMLLALIYPIHSTISNRKTIQKCLLRFFRLPIILYFLLDVGCILLELTSPTSVLSISTNFWLLKIKWHRINHIIFEKDPLKFRVRICRQYLMEIETDIKRIKHLHFLKKF